LLRSRVEGIGIEGKGDDTFDLVRKGKDNVMVLELDESRLSLEISLGGDCLMKDI
jgi:hypothetical protein